LSVWFEGLNANGYTALESHLSLWSAGPLGDSFEGGTRVKQKSPRGDTLHRRFVMVERFFQHITKPALIIGGAIYAYQNLLLLLTVTLHIRWPIHFAWASIQSSNSVVSSICLHSSRDIVWWRYLILISSFSEGKLSIIEGVLGLDGRWPGRQACVLQ